MANLCIMKAKNLDGSTHQCDTEQCGGGVGRNIAEALWRLRGGRTRLLTAIGDDADGNYLANIVPGLILDGCITKGGRTSNYASVMDPKGECIIGLGDMSQHDHITVDLVKKNINILEQAPLVVVDGNVPQKTTEYIMELCHSMQKPVFFEPTDRRKASKPFHSKHKVTYSSPNINELRAMASFLNPNIPMGDSGMNEIINLAKIVSEKVEFIIVTLGAKGILTINSKKHNISIKHYQTEVIDNIENVSGAGDCFTSGFITGMLLGCKESENVFIGFDSAKKALQSVNTVPHNLTNNITINKVKFLLYKN